MTQMNQNRFLVRSGHNRLLLSLLSFEERRKQVRIFWLYANLIRVAPSTVIQVGPPACIVALLAEMRIF
jgi:hypothetical protein